MAPYGPERETPRRQVGLAAGIMVLALAVPYLSDDLQAQIAVTLQGTALAPFIALQERITEGRARADQIEYLQATLDSLVAVSSTQSRRRKSICSTSNLPASIFEKSRMSLITVSR